MNPFNQILAKKGFVEAFRKQLVENSREFRIDFLDMESLPAKQVQQLVIAFDIVNLTGYDEFTLREDLEIVCSELEIPFDEEMQDFSEELADCLEIHDRRKCNRQFRKHMGFIVDFRQVDNFLGSAAWIDLKCRDSSSDDVVLDLTFDELEGFFKFNLRFMIAWALKTGGVPQKLGMIQVLNSRLRGLPFEVTNLIIV